MGAVMNENEFKLQFYFNLYKDKSMINSSMFRAKFKKLHGDFKYLDKLVVAIENYQIKKVWLHFRKWIYG